MRAALDSPAPSFEPREAPENNLVDHIERYVYQSARHIGFSNLLANTLADNRESPELADCLGQLISDLHPDIERLLETEGGRNADLVVPSHFSRFFDLVPASEEYIPYMGFLALREAAERKAWQPLDWADLADLHLNLSRMAIAEALALLKVAFEQEAFDVVSVMLGKPSCMANLAINHLDTIIEFHRFLNPNLVVFFKDSILKAETLTPIALKDLDYDADRNLAAVRSFPMLTLLFVEVANVDRSFSSGSMTLRDKDSFEPMPGMVYRTDDPCVPRIISDMANDFARSICYSDLDASKDDLHKKWLQFRMNESSRNWERFKLDNWYRGSLLAKGIAEGNPILVEEGLNNGENPNQRYSYEVDNDSITIPNPVKTITPIVQAAVNENLDITKLLIEHGADPNLCQKNGESALMDAVNRGNAEITEYLLEHGADPNLKTNAGTALIYADNVIVMKMLLDYGADPNIPDGDGDLPIIGSIDNRRMDEIELLIRCGTDMGHENKKGETPLDRASRRGILSEVKYLMGQYAQR